MIGKFAVTLRNNDAMSKEVSRPLLGGALAGNCRRCVPAFIYYQPPPRDFQ